MSPMLKCPRCKIQMKPVVSEDVEVDACEKCQGVWVEHIEEKQWLQIKPQNFSMDELMRLRKAYEPYEQHEKVQYLPCPHCQELMHRRNWGSHSGVIVDRCREHGTWYDKDEVEKIQEFVLMGGIEYEKMQYSKKQMVRLESKLTQEVSRLDLKSDSLYRRARFWSILGF